MAKAIKQPKATQSNPYTAPSNFATVPHVRPTTVAAAQQQIALLRQACNAVRALRQVAPLTPVQFAWLKHNAHYYRRLQMRITKSPAGSNPFAPAGSATSPVKPAVVAAQVAASKGKKTA